MIRTVKIVVNGLRYAHNAALIAHLLHVLADLVAGIHGIVAAVIEEIAHVIFFEDFENALVIRIIHVAVLELITAGTKRRGRRMHQQRQFRGGLRAHIVQRIVQYAANTVRRAVHLGNAGAVQRRTDYAVSAGVDHSGRSAGLPNDAGTLEFFHESYPPVVYLINQKGPKGRGFSHASSHFPKFLHI